MTTKLDVTFGVYSGRFGQLSEYIEAVTPGLILNRRGLPLFVESTIVLIEAWHEDFLASLVAHATCEKEPETRRYLIGQGRREAADCTLESLIAMAVGRIGFKNRGQRMEEIFLELFGFSPWPNDTIRNQIVDLGLLRQIVVHHSSGVLGDDYWNQLTDKTLLGTNQCRDLPTIRRINHEEGLIFIRNVTLALIEQFKYLRSEMSHRPEWQL
jgi:hypothetical protein